MGATGRTREFFPNDLEALRRKLDRRTGCWAARRR